MYADVKQWLCIERTAWQWHGSEELSVHCNGAEMQSAVGTGNGVVAR